MPAANATLGERLNYGLGLLPVKARTLLLPPPRRVPLPEPWLLTVPAMEPLSRTVRTELRQRENAVATAFAALTKQEDILKPTKVTVPATVDSGQRPQTSNFVLTGSEILAALVPSKTYTTNEADRTAFERFYVGSGNGNGNGTTDRQRNQEFFDTTLRDVEAWKRANSHQHPQVTAIPSRDLVALIGCSGFDYNDINRPMVRLAYPQMFTGHFDPAAVDQLRESMPYTNAIVSAINQLPGCTDARLYRGSTSRTTT